MKVLVTGGAGFIGSHLVPALVDRGWEVTVIDSLITGREKSLDGVKKKITFVRGDVTDQQLLNRLTIDQDIVFHLAALPSIPRSIEDPLSSHLNNVSGTFHVLLAASKAGVKRVVYSASSSVYGDSPQRVKHENLPAKPTSPYGLTKYIGEQYADNFKIVFGLQTVSLRYFNIFGPRQDPLSAYAAVIPKFIVSALTGKPLIIFGDGTIERDFTYVENVVAANIAAAVAENAAGTYNVACGRATSLNQLAKLIGRLAGEKTEVVYAPARPGDIQRSQASIRKARRDLGYRPQFNLAKGLKETFRWYRDNLHYFA